MTNERITTMEMTSDLTAIQERLVAGARRDLRRRRSRVRFAGAFAAAALAVSAGAAAAAGLGLVDVGGLRVSSQAELPPVLAGVPAATLIAGDPNALACGDGGWVAATAVMQSPHDPAAIPGCHTPTAAERAEYRDAMVASDPLLAQPLPYWYQLDEASLAASEGRPGAAAAISPVYIGSATPLSPDQLADPANWRVTVSGVGSLQLPTTPLAVPPAASAPATQSTRHAAPAHSYCVFRATGKDSAGKLRFTRTCH
jgi:hypothetical protein